MDTGTFSSGDADEHSLSVYIFVMGIIVTKSFECESLTTVKVPNAPYERVHWNGGISVSEKSAGFYLKKFLPSSRCQRISWKRR
jgi:hypothetical protein